MTADESDLQFIRCPGCRSLVPAVATRCRMCGQLLEPKSRDTSDSLSKKSRVRQRTMSVSEDERDSLRERVLSGDFSDEEEFPVEGEDYDELPEDVRGFAEPGDQSFHSSEGATSSAPRPTLEESWSFEEQSYDESANESATSEDHPEEDDFDEEDHSEEHLAGEAQPKRKRRRRRKKRNATSVESADSADESEAEHTPTIHPEIREPQRSSAVVREPNNPARVAGGIGWNRPEGTSSSVSSQDEVRRSVQEVSSARSAIERPRAAPPRSEPTPSEHSAPDAARVTGRSGVDQMAQVPTSLESGELVGWLVFHEGETTVSRELRGGQFFVSRERLRPQDVVFDHPTVSMPQCLLFAHHDSGVTVQDLMSENGTFVRRMGNRDFERQHGQFRVDHGDVMRFGELEVMLCLLPRS